MKAADAIVECLKKEEVTTVFGYPGAAIMPLYEALRKSPIRHVLVRQEQAAAHSASGYARTSGKVGVCIATSGPGATNLITGIATAYMDSIPLVAFTGQVKSTLIGRDVFQEVDITGATEPFIKHSYLVKDAKDLPRIIKEAFHIAKTGRPGPVLIDIPVDMQNENIEFSYDEEVNIRGYKPTYIGHIGQIKRALRRLKDSKKPIICIGGGIVSAKAEKELLAFAEKSKIPVVCTLMGLGGMDHNSPYYIGMIGSHGDKVANKAVSEADVAVFMGARIADRATGGSKLFAKNADIIHIDVDPAEIGKNLGTSIPVVGDVKNILEQFLEMAQPLNTDEWVKYLTDLKQSGIKNRKPSSNVNPKYAIQLLSEVLDQNAILVADVGQNQMWSARNFKIFDERKFFTSGGLGTMGYSLPAAIGAAIAAPNRQVVATMGDGGFQMSFFELATLKQNKVKLIILLFNNEGLGMVREMQYKNYKAEYGVNLSGNPDFIKLADAYGIKGRRVLQDDELKEVFDEAIHSDETFLIECIVDPKESTL
ncbi:biosynthetic-type acetolactate synthase large subunit [Defluviitalea raffinosedens]|uniref:biosynthetic-type acetolactate synthase large subunit n=1 Tax=Defluviitalea raffinosedens TaxID=1450156 RepID=UPI00195AF635|nr:biosynthetic-type acetolactate synthase large subunit [Defluviitalea raffinosedens]MBM7684676.1 acetolactate synthase-1/2/3 large subunit [Defluviitalea raffinosedens]